MKVKKALSDLFRSPRVQALCFHDHLPTIRGTILAIWAGARGPVDPVNGCPSPTTSRRPLTEKLQPSVRGSSWLSRGVSLAAGRLGRPRKRVRHGG